MGLSDNGSGSPFYVSSVGLPMKPAPLRGHIIWDNAFLFSPTAIQPSISATPMGISSLKGRKSYEKGIIAGKKKCIVGLLALFTSSRTGNRRVRLHR